MLVFVICLAAVLLLLTVLIARQPDQFRFSRSINIEAPAAAVFAEVDDLHRWESWSPWAKLDPQAVYVFEGPAQGVGATTRWEGNLKVGKGNMTIIDSQTPRLVRLRLEFLKPMQAVNTSEFTFTEENGRTHVQWSMEGHNNIFAKAFSLVMPCEKMLGGQFDKGLAQLKSVAENRA